VRTALHRKMASETPAQGILASWVATCSFVPSGTPASSWWTAFALVLATPKLLWNTPPSHPVRVTCHAVIRLRRGGASYLAWTSLPVHATAPRLFANRPSNLPVCVSVSTIVRVSRSHRSDGDNWLWDHKWRWCSRWATLVVDTATPYLLRFTPCALGIDCTVERVACWHWSGWAWSWWQSWPRWRHSEGRGWWRSWRCCWSRFGECCCQASHPRRHAAVLLLLLRPQELPVCHSCTAIKWQGSREQA